MKFYSFEKEFIGCKSENIAFCFLSCSAFSTSTSSYYASLLSDCNSSAFLKSESESLSF